MNTKVFPVMGLLKAPSPPINPTINGTIGKSVPGLAAWVEINNLWRNPLVLKSKLSINTKLKGA